MSKKDLTRRESLKKIAVNSLPATLTLLTSKRAVAQSPGAQCTFRVINNHALPVQINGSFATVNAGQTRDIPASAGTVYNFETTPVASAHWDVPAVGIDWDASGIGFTLPSCNTVVVTVSLPTNPN